MDQIFSRQIVTWNVPLVIIIIVIMMVRHAAFLVLGEIINYLKAIYIKIIFRL